MSPPRFTPNQLVAWNLGRARRLRGLNQEQAAEVLEPYLGERWSKATFSAAERSVDGERIRQFTADDLQAFSRAFNLPITYFLCPSPIELEIGHGNGGETQDRLDLLDSIFRLSEDARAALVGAEFRSAEIIEMSAETTRRLRRWAADFAALVHERERQIERAGFEIRRDELAPEEEQ